MDKTNGNAAQDAAAADLQATGFDAAKQVLDVARFILAGEPTEEAPVERAAQATREPSRATVQKPAAE